MQAAPPPRKGRGGLVAIILIAVLVVVLGGGYAVVGYLYANSKVNAATDKYNSVVDHENALTDYFNTLDSQFNKTDLSNATVDQVKQEKTLFQQAVTKSQASESTVTADDATLADAQASLGENSWLTAIDKSAIDKQSAKIGYARQALGVAKTILVDSVQYYQFYMSIDDAVVDIDAMTKALDAQDLNGAIAAVQTLKTDLGKAAQLESAPGVSSTMTTFVQDMQTLANDFGALLTAAQQGDQTGAQQAAARLDADLKALDAIDFTAASTQETAFYKNLIDQYNAFVDKANKA
jgi:hypothetical protein